MALKSPGIEELATAHELRDGTAKTGLSSQVHGLQREKEPWYVFRRKEHWLGPQKMSRVEPPAT